MLNLISPKRQKKRKEIVSEETNNMILRWIFQFSCLVNFHFFCIGFDFGGKIKLYNFWRVFIYILHYFLKFAPLETANLTRHKSANDSYISCIFVNSQ